MCPGSADQVPRLQDQGKYSSFVCAYLSFSRQLRLRGYQGQRCKGRTLVLRGEWAGDAGWRPLRGWFNLTNELALLSAYCDVPISLSVSSGSGRCSSSARMPLIQASHSSGRVKLTGIDFKWMGAPSAFGGQVKEAYRSSTVSPFFTLQNELQPRVSVPAKNIVVSALTGGSRCTPCPLPRGSEKLVTGNRQRFWSPSQRRQCGEPRFRRWQHRGSAQSLGQTQVRAYLIGL